MLTLRDLEGMIATVTAALPDTCTIIDTPGVSDGAGGQTKGTPTSVSVACRVAPRLATGTGQLKDAEMDTAGRIMDQAPWLITMPTGTVIHATSQVRDSNNRTFEVFAVLARRSEELSTMVLARLINEGRG